MGCRLSGHVALALASSFIKAPGLGLLAVDLYCSAKCPSRLLPALFWFSPSFLLSFSSLRMHFSPSDHLRFVGSDPGWLLGACESFGAELSSAL